jgi:hypothetical protein
LIGCNLSGRGVLGLRGLYRGGSPTSEPLHIENALLVESAFGVTDVLYKSYNNVLICTRMLILKKKRHTTDIEMQPLLCTHRSDYAGLHDLMQMYQNAVTYAHKLGVCNDYIERWVYYHEVPTKFTLTKHLTPENISFLALPAETRDTHLRYESRYFLQSQKKALDDIKDYLEEIHRCRASITIFDSVHS